MIGLQPVAERDLIHRHSWNQTLRHDPRLDLIRPLTMRFTFAPPRRENLQVSMEKLLVTFP